MFKKKKEVTPVSEVPLVPTIPEAFKKKYGTMEETISEATKAVDDFAGDEIEAIQQRINKLKRTQAPIQPTAIEPPEPMWEIVVIPERRVLRNRETQQEIEITEENFINLLNYGS